MADRRIAYPIVISKEDDGYYVEIPDFDMATQGENIADAMAMARDAIGIMGIDMEDDGKTLPLPGSAQFETSENDIVTLVDVDFVEYRRKVDNRVEKKNCTIPIKAQREVCNVILTKYNAAFYIQCEKRESFSEGEQAGYQRGHAVGDAAGFKREVIKCVAR